MPNQSQQRTQPLRGRSADFRSLGDTTMSSIVFRNAQSSDAASAWALRTEAIRSNCASHYSKEIVDSWSAMPMPTAFGEVLEKEQYVVAEIDGCIVGFAGLKAEAKEVDAVFVTPALVRTGLGKQLLERVESQARQLGFKAVALHASLNSVPFYLRSGYSEIAKGFHSTRSGLSIACVHMEKQLAGIA